MARKPIPKRKMTPAEFRDEIDRDGPPKMGTMASWGGSGSFEAAGKAGDAAAKALAAGGAAKLAYDHRDKIASTAKRVVHGAGEALYNAKEKVKNFGVLPGYETTPRKRK